MDNKLVIGVDVCCWLNRRGFGRFTRELITALLALDQQNDYVFFADALTAEQADLPASARLVVVKTRFAPIQAASASGRRSARDLLAMSRAVFREPIDALFFPAVYTFFPVFNRARLYLTVHDLIANNHPALVFPNRKLEIFWKMKQRFAVWQAHRILTVSDSSKREIVRSYGLSPGNVSVIPEAPAALFSPLERGADPSVLRRHGIDPAGRFFLHVGGFSPHKNLPLLVSALAGLHQEVGHSDVRLVFAGDYQNDSFHSGFSELSRQAEGLGLSHAVHFAGYVPDEDLVHLYHAATALVFPSLEEGFGLPAVEAMACGTPLLASNRGSLPEIGGEAGLYFDPMDAAGLTARLQEILAQEPLRLTMKKRSLARARDFSWQRAAEKVRDVMQQGGRPG